MSERRCPKCGGLVGADAEWCTQCFTRLDDAETTPAREETPTTTEASPGSDLEGGETAPPRPSISRPPVPRSEIGAGLRTKGENIVWDCPACGTENPIEAAACSACGTRFGQMFQEPAEERSMDPGRAAVMSLFFPGAGHFALGRKGEAFARGIIFAFALILGLAALGPVRAGRGGTYLLLMVISLGSAATLYLTSTADAGRAALGQQQILSMRMLLYGAVGLMFAAVVLLTIAATQARG